MFRSAVFIASLIASPAFSEPSFVYLAQIDSADMHSSNGEPLSGIADILQQDRANIHRFGAVTEGDAVDPYFGDFQTRARMPYLYQPGPAEFELEALMELVMMGATITLHVEVCLRDEKPVRIGIQYSTAQHKIC